MKRERHWWLVDAHGRVRLEIFATVNFARAMARKVARHYGLKLTLTDRAPHARAPQKRRRSSHARRSSAHQVKRRGRKPRRISPRRPRRRRRRNPGTAELGQAAAMFRKFHGFDASTVSSAAGERTIPRTLVRLGDLVEVTYRSNKFDRKSRDYVHKFGTPRPTLCTRPDGRGLLIVGGRFRNTARGIVG
jgi:hypothetical protein